ncbi:cysteine desulfurase family protein [Methylococcus sp. EFPC2]|uniref:cysteine desulfurase family protein n=1 Tax=Methylococcus sp. EFPC2 TaxID=2812648 RepID=UPI00196872E8|nr:cysteine desulfurase family protein [Methylococcus sp. EFPC2]QSA96769.1 cysteine desulfurase [Methylococcus sp. EFPC2]
MIYLDHNATTPLDERVRESMLPYLGPLYGNPSSLHRLGRIARSAIGTAREQVAALVGAQPSEVIFTASGTEADNLAIKGLAGKLRPGVIASPLTEHPAVTGPLDYLSRHDWRIQTLAVDAQGSLTGDSQEAWEHPDLRFATVMLANNETGVIQDIARVADRLRARGLYLHCDAVQAAGKLPLDFHRCGAHLLSISAHKIYGPKGAGALIVQTGVELEPLLHGGGQERDLRGGTENVAALVGFGKAAELAKSELDQRYAHMLRLRQVLESGLASLPGATIFAGDSERLPNTVQFALTRIDGEALVMALDRRGFAVSSGSACASGAGEPSPVLLAMGVEPDVAKGAVRVSFGKDNSEEQVPLLLQALKNILADFGLNRAAG